MQHINEPTRPSLHKCSTLAKVAIFAALVVTVACSTNNGKPAASSPVAANSSVNPVAISTIVPVKESGPGPAKKPPMAKLSNFVSRDYGVSFQYPWQYALLNARRIADDDSRQPQSDGHDGQFTLAQVEIPRGFYPDSDFESGRFSLSVNQTLSEEECLQTLSSNKDAKLQTTSVGGSDLKWVATSMAGHGRASLTRSYVAFEGGTCYEMELRVATANEDGMARELDPEQVMRRLDSILQTVKILPSTEERSIPAVESSAKAEPEASPQR
jgi:hypothetical protein